MGFYPCPITVTWEQRDQVTLGKQLTSGIQLNGDRTFQIQVSIEQGQEGVSPAEHVFVVRHSSLGDAPLRVTWGVHHLSHLQLISPWAAPGLPKLLHVMMVDDLVRSTYDSNTRRLAPRSGYNPANQEFWSAGNAACMAWDSWVETKYQALVQEVNASSPQAEPYHMQILKTCELDDATGAVRAVTRYSLNGEDVLRYQSDQNRWFSEHPAAWRVAERWNREGETFTVWNLIQPQHCRFFIELTLPFIAQKTAQPSVRVALVPGTQDRPRCLVCHVTGFYPRDIEVIWERGGQVVHGEQLTSGILPNGDLTFQIQVSIELGQEGVGPAEHVCVAYRPVHGSLVPRKDSLGTDIFRNDNGDCIVHSDLGCYLQMELLENIKIQRLHPLCQGGDDYLGCVEDPNIYIIKGSSYRVVKDLSMDEEAKVYELHPSCCGGDTT
ncbi:Major histocompatibility complex class I-related gene protein [Chelonia mydas]|uniref:Major histocompatibility complex class I-related gene protein n=1 Tax=Chelonia mydas TaxID=8469 RepID=M7ANM8_CHEMY|nr:Major histocompatibility complex class I-related gene protein [Chelonia mydas]